LTQHRSMMGGTGPRWQPGGRADVN
jgi:hypothetical protein